MQHWAVQQGNLANFQCIWLGNLAKHHTSFARSQVCFPAKRPNVAFFATGPSWVLKNNSVLLHCLPLLTICQQLDVRSANSCNYNRITKISKIKVCIICHTLTLRQAAQMKTLKILDTQKCICITIFTFNFFVLIMM